MHVTARQMVYGALALAGLVATWFFNLRFVSESGGAFDAVAFVRAGYANSASASLSSDLLVGLTAFLVWSFAEARRLEMRHWWVYPVLTFGIAFALAFPLFLLIRERRLAALGGGAALAALLVFAGGTARAQALDWSRYAGEETVQVTTADADGDERSTTVWLVVVDGQGYIRTGGTHWGDNVERSPELVLHVGSDAFPMRVEFVDDDAAREGVSQAFRAKYGFQDRMLAVLRGSRPRIMRLLPLAQEEPAR